MGSLLLGVAAALAASALYNSGLILQSGRAQAVPPEDASGLRLVLRLLRDRRWLLGAALDLLGLPLHALALLLAPVTAVQPALAAGLLLLLLAARRGRGLHPRETAGVLAVVAGVSGIAALAPERSAQEAGGLALAATLGVLATIVIVAAAVSGRREAGAARASAAAMIAAGFAYALSAILMKLMTNDFAAREWPLAAAWLAVILCVDAFGFGREMTALQRRPAAQIGAMIFAVPVVVPVILAPLLFGEAWGATPLGGVPLGISVLATAAGVVALAGSPMMEAALPAGGHGR